MTQNKKNSDWPETLTIRATAVWRFLKCIFKEIRFGIRNNTAPTHYLGLGSLAISILVVKKPNWILLAHAPHGVFVAVATFLITTPFLGFGLYRYGELRKMLKRVTTVFREASLVTSLNRMPQFSSHQQIDESVFEMTFTLNGVLYSQFVGAKEYLRGCFDHVEDIIDHENGEVSVRYSRIPLPTNTQIYDIPETSGPYSFAVGQSRAGLVTANLLTVPHLLVAGSTNSGKSTFIRQFVATLLAKNKGAAVKFIDLKHSLEARIFRGVKGVSIIAMPSAAIGVLEEACKEIEAKAAFLLENKCSNLEDLAAKSDSDIKWTKKYADRNMFGRTMIVVDEAAELFLASSRLEPKEAQRANRLATTIAATGRAVGIHILIATQRPDRVAIDSKIKANLIGRLVFHMADNASSLTALDNVRAAKIPNEPGRAIWRDGQEMKEVKTLLFKEEDLSDTLIRKELKDPDKGPISKNKTGFETAPREAAK